MSSVFRRKIAIVLSGLLALALSAAFAQAGSTAGDVFRLSVARGGDGGVEFTWTISPGHYLYRDKIGARTQEGKVLAVKTPAGERKEVPSVGTEEIYEGSVKASVAAGDLPGSGTILVSFQGCAAGGICYPPVVKTVDLSSLAMSDDKGNASPGGPSGLRPLPAGKPDRSPQPPASGLSGSLPATLSAFLAFGLMLSLTPCVFPMIPILSGMLASSGGKLSAGRGFVLSGSYVLAMACAYGTLGIAAGWTGRNLQAMLQTPLALGLMSLVYAALALSMFGLYDLQLPAAWMTRLSGATASRGGRGGRGGSVGAAALLGFGSALVVGPCVTPPLAAALMYAAQAGGVARGASALFALGLGMGLPLLAFGTFGGGLLPKAGRWLVVVKQVFGFVFLGLAVWMLGRVLPAPATLALWCLLALTCGAWLGMSGLVRGAVRRFACGGAAALLGILLALYAAGPTPWFPSLSLGHAAKASETNPDMVRTVTTGAAFDAALAEAQTMGMPVLVDFSAAWCIACREIDNSVMADPDIRSRLRGVFVIRADVTEDTDDTRALLRRFGVAGPPTMFLLDPKTGREIDDTRSVGVITASQFANALSRAGA